MKANKYIGQMLVWRSLYTREVRTETVADPGFPRGGGANPQGGAPRYDFIKFSQKLHEIKENSAPRGGRASPVPPLRSATERDREIERLEGFVE